MATFQEAATALGAKQVKMVDALTNANPVLEQMEVFPSNNNLQHAYEELTEVVGAELRDLNAAPKEVDAKSTLMRAHLQILSGRFFVSADQVQAVAKGDLKAYVDKKFPKIVRVSGNEVESSILYNYFRALAIAKGRYESADSSPSGSAYFSMMALRMEEDECGLVYNENAYEKGELLSIEALNGGAKTRNSDGIAGWDFEMTAYLTPFAASSRHYAALVNIDSDNVPSKAAINDLISDVRPEDGGRTVLIMSPFLLSLLEQAHGSSPIRTAGLTDDFGAMPLNWYGTRIVTTHQMKHGTETAVPAA